MTLLLFWLLNFFSRCFLCVWIFLWLLLCHLRKGVGRFLVLKIVVTTYWVSFIFQVDVYMCYLINSLSRSYMVDIICVLLINFTDRLLTFINGRSGIQYSNDLINSFFPQEESAWVLWQLFSSLFKDSFFHLCLASQMCSWGLGLLYVWPLEAQGTTAHYFTLNMLLKPEATSILMWAKITEEPGQQSF